MYAVSLLIDAQDSDYPASLLMLGHGTRPDPHRHARDDLGRPGDAPARAAGYASVLPAERAGNSAPGPELPASGYASRGDGLPQIGYNYSMLHYSEPEVLISVHGLEDQTPGPVEWTDRGDGVRWKRFVFGGPGGPWRGVTVCRRPGGGVDLDAPGLAERSSHPTPDGSVRVVHLAPAPAA